MKFLVMAGFLLLNLNVHAADSIVCMEDAGDVVLQVEISLDCEVAIAVARKCSFGSSADVDTVEAAVNLCFEQIGKLSREDFRLYKSMNRRCNLAYGQPGSEYASKAAHCRLNVMEYIHDVVTAR